MAKRWLISKHRWQSFLISTFTFCHYVKNFLFLLGKKWQERRKIITPAFHFKMLEKFSETFNRISNTFVEKLMERDSDKAIELFHMVELFALDVICGM